MIDRDTNPKIRTRCLNCGNATPWELDMPDFTPTTPPGCLCEHGTFVAETAAGEMTSVVRAPKGFTPDTLAVDYLDDKAAAAVADFDNEHAVRAHLDEINPVRRALAPPRFALIGAAGYVAPRHMRAIREIGGDLVAVLDPHDSVGILDTHAPGCLYFREPERFERFLLRHPVDWVAVCSPNYLHDAHCIMAMRAGANVICEKPLVLREANIDMLSRVEQETSRRVNVVLQCRLHPDAIGAKRALTAGGYRVRVDYCTPRGPWYHWSWKGEPHKSGGLPTNIGVHLFDLCSWLFGEQRGRGQHRVDTEEAVGWLPLERAEIHWRLSVRREEAAQRVFRVDGGDNTVSLDLTKGFTDLHTELYRRTIRGKGYGIEDIRPATRMVEQMRRPT